jgi:hypothetical protein
VDFPDATTLANNDTCYRIDVMLPNGGCTSSKSMTAKIKSTSNSSSNKTIAIPSNVGFQTIDKPIHFSLYPNPVNDNLTIQVETIFEGMQYKVFDLLGNLVRDGKLNAAQTHLNVSSIADGVYFLEISGGKQKAVQKLIIE